MAVHAKDQIVSAFLDLLLQKPLDKLTVTDVVRSSGVTRQTFYYHFQDIPALITFMAWEDFLMLILPQIIYDKLDVFYLAGS